MKDYFDAYKERRQAVHDELMSKAKILTNLGYTVYMPKNEMITFIKVIDETHSTQCAVMWEEVPCRWIINISIVPSKEKGSSFSLTEQMEPYSARQIIKAMKPYTDKDGRRVSIDVLVKRTKTYLKKFEL
jgi:L-rhamnose mutarotase